MTLNQKLATDTHGHIQEIKAESSKLKEKTINNPQLTTNRLCMSLCVCGKKSSKMIEINGRTVAWHEGMTISDLLAEIIDTHPYPVVRIDDRYVSRPNFDKTTVPDNSEVFLIPMIAGG